MKYKLKSIDHNSIIIFTIHFMENNYNNFIIQRHLLTFEKIRNT